MKNKIFLTFVSISLSNAIFSEESKQKFAEKNTIELGGDLSFFYNVDNATGKNAEVKGDPKLSWYFMKSLHIGGALGLRYFYSDRWLSTSEGLSLAPALHLGYTVPVSQKIFFDISAFSGFYVYFQESRAVPRRGVTGDYLFGVLPALKVDTDNGLVSFGLVYVYDGGAAIMRSAIGSVISYSIYF